ncbi:MAG TPA: hypothetical protein VEH47_07260 [Candidatus Acidoferrales bacterium]|nr:hypothetical protein [Candidatus Acidoferrales bacterium]
MFQFLLIIRRTPRVCTRNHRGDGFCPQCTGSVDESRHRIDSNFLAVVIAAKKERVRGKPRTWIAWKLKVL